MRTCAKVNLFLKVLDTRPDGYHNLETVFLPIPELCDEVTVSPTDGNDHMIDCNRPELNTEDNLCLKAVRAYCAFTGCQSRYRVNLTKRIPIAAGLGGGSSDAAATLLQLNALNNSSLSRQDLVHLAASVGADVPFFLQSVPAAATGIGDILSPLEIASKLNVLVVSPGIPIPVKWAYDHCTPQSSVPFDEFQRICASGSAESIAKCCHNDLEYAIFEKFPLLAMMRDCLLSLGAFCAHVSGSGSSLFALLPDDARNIRDKFQAAFSDISTLSLNG